MEEYYKNKLVAMPSPERIAKVDLTMCNLLDVIKERNLAFNLLETGETKENKTYRRFNSFGFIQRYKEREHLVPWFLNKNWKAYYHYKKLPLWSRFYRTLYRKKLRKDRNKLRRRVSYAVRESLRKNPELSNQVSYVREYFEKKYDYRPPMSFDELIKQPSTNQLSKKFEEQINSKKKFYDDDL